MKTTRMGAMLAAIVMIALGVFAPAALLALQPHALPLTVPLIVGATLATGNPTWLDLANALDPNGQVADIVELLNQVNPVLDEMTVIEGNLLTGHKSTIRTGIPLPTWRKLYGTVAPTKGTTAQVTDSTGMLEAYADVDKALADLNGNAPAYRLSEDASHIEGMSQELAQTLFYGNEALEPEAFTGFAPRFSSLSAANADNIVDHGGTGSDNASIWLVVWGKKTVHGIVPKGSKAGIQVHDKGQITIQESTGMREAYLTHYRADMGLVVRDWRYVVRICNIDVSDLATIANTKAIINSMISATERIPNFSAGRAAFYMPRRIREALRQGIVEKIAANLNWENVAGKRVLMFDEVPVRRTDALLLTEARVT